MWRIAADITESGGGRVGLLDVSFHCYCNYVHYIHSGGFSSCPIVMIMCIGKALNKWKKWRKENTIHKWVKPTQLWKDIALVLQRAKCCRVSVYFQFWSHFCLWDCCYASTCTLYTHTLCTLNNAWSKATVGPFGKPPPSCGLSAGR